MSYSFKLLFLGVFSVIFLESSFSYAVNWNCISQDQQNTGGDFLAVEFNDKIFISLSYPTADRQMRDYGNMSMYTEKGKLGSGSLSWTSKGRRGNLSFSNMSYCDGGSNGCLQFSVNAQGVYNAPLRGYLAFGSQAGEYFGATLHIYNDASTKMNCKFAK